MSYCAAIGMGAHPHDSPAGPAGGRLGADLAAHVEAIVHAAEREARAAEQAIADHRRSAEEEVRRYLAAARLHVDAETAARAARIETLSAAARRLSEELTDAVAALARELHADDRALADRLPRPPWPAAHQPAPERPQSAAPPAEPPERPAPAPVTPQPSWSRIEGTEAVAPSASGANADRAGALPGAGAGNADRAGGAAEDDSATPLAESPGWAGMDRPARSSVGPEDAGSPAAAANGSGAASAVPSAARLVAIEMAVGGSSRAEVEEHLRERLGVGDPEPLLDDVFGVASHAGSRLAWGEP